MQAFLSKKSAIYVKNTVDKSKKYTTIALAICYNKSTKRVGERKKRLIDWYWII